MKIMEICLKLGTAKFCKISYFFYDNVHFCNRKLHAEMYLRETVEVLML